MTVTSPTWLDKMWKTALPAGLGHGDTRHLERGGDRVRQVVEGARGGVHLVVVGGLGEGFEFGEVGVGPVRA